MPDDAAAPRTRELSEHPRDRTVTAVLGPTNTGKTHYAIERMLSHRTGVIGLPLRLLAREIYDRIVDLRGPSTVALVTGEEKIAPARATHWVCTVEAMPLEQGADFVAVDEIQLCADPDRGHVFTDRLLHARGLHETLFLGSDTMRDAIRELIPKARFVGRERFSTLSYSGSRKLSRMPARSAVVGFSADNVYAIAELVRRQKGGAAVVMGALSPRTRNAQVALYQNGDVDHLVATDAIGMGLNLDVKHVAFAGLSKFDGRRFRNLRADELAQIAGRAGRHSTDGTFGVTAEAPGLEPEAVEAIENHRFAPVRRLQWRSSRLEFGTVEALIGSLEAAPDLRVLCRARDADDLMTLRALAADADADIRDRSRGGPAVRRLWEVCQLPDFRKVSEAEHAALATRIYRFLMDGPGCIPCDWMEAQIRRLDRVEGDIDALSKRLAFIRTWTYVANRRDWVEDAPRWRDAAREVEDRLSDALHARLTQRFVDRRTSVLMRRLKQKEVLVAEVSENGDVTAEGHSLGRLDGFRFTPDPSASGDELKTLRAASAEALQVEFNRRADRFYNAPDTEIDLTEQGGLMWGEHAVGRLAKGPDTLSPEVEPFVDEMAGPDARQKVERRLSHWINRRVAALFEPLVKMRDDAEMTGLARGIAFRLVESLGVIPRPEIAADVKELDQEGRAHLRRHGVRFGQHTIFMPALLKPAPTRLRIALWALAEDLTEFPTPPPPGLVTIPATAGSPAGFYQRAGYRLAGRRAIRIDMLERLADMIRAENTREGFEAKADMLSITGCTLEQFADLMRGMGYKAERGERPKPAAEEPAAPEAEQATAEATVEAAVDAPEAETPTESVAEAPATSEAERAPNEATTEAGSEEAAEAAGPDGEAKDGETKAGETKAAEGESELQIYYVFTWAARPRGGQRRGQRRGGDSAQGEAATEGEGGRQRRGKGGQRGGGAQGAPQGERQGGPQSDRKGGPKGAPKHGKGGKKRPERDEGARAYASASPRRRTEVDPDSPFAALMALKSKD